MHLVGMDERNHTIICWCMNNLPIRVEVSHSHTLPSAIHSPYVYRSIMWVESENIHNFMYLKSLKSAFCSILVIRSATIHVSNYISPTNKFSLPNLIFSSNTIYLYKRESGECVLALSQIELLVTLLTLSCDARAPTITFHISNSLTLAVQMKTEHLTQTAPLSSIHNSICA